MQQTIRIGNSISNDKDWKQVLVIRNPQSGIENPRLSGINLCLLVIHSFRTLQSKEIEEATFGSFVCKAM